MDLHSSYNKFLRKSRPKSLECPFCLEPFLNTTEESFKLHVESDHADALAGNPDPSTYIVDLFKAAKPISNSNRPKRLASNQATDGPLQGSNEDEPRGRPTLDTERPASAGSSLKREGSNSVSPSRPAKGRPASSPVAPVAIESPSEFSRGPQKGGRLWTPEDGPSQSRAPGKGARSNQPKGLANHPTQPSVGRRAQAQVEEDFPRMIKQPETRPISQEQLVAEVKGIYAGLVMVESKCIEVDNMQNSQQDPNNNRLNHEQWQALIALHRTLLHEHHDFFLASQHPSASAPLRRLASKYAMPARMWRHGIHSFLELLRHRLPSSLEHMLTFIYLAYAMMALLYETVPAFEDTWIECLGDLGRYRMAIEEEDIKDREVWTIVSRHWYSKASDKAATTGRLYHHLAILARPNALLQLFYYNKSLCVAIPFLSARDSILTLFDPIMALPATHQTRLPAIELAFVRCHSIMFSGKSPERLEPSMDEFISSLDNHIARSGLKFLEAGYTISISDSCAVMGYGNEANSVFAEIREIDSQSPHQNDHNIDESEVQEKTNPTPPTPEEIDMQREVTAHAIKLSNLTHNVVLRRFGDLNTLPYIHATLAFVYHMMFCTESMERHIGPGFPWQLLAENLNTLLNAPSLTPAMLDRIEGDTFPEVVGDLYGGNKGPDAEMATTNVPKRKPLPEDFAMRGLLWTEKYLPDGYFQQERIDDEEKYFEVPSMAEQRRERVLFLGCRIAEVGKQRFLRYSNKLFSAGREFTGELGNLPESTTSRDLGVLPDANTAASG